METEVVLKMLVEMGVINAGQIDDLRAKLDGLNEETGKVADSTSDASTETENSVDKMEDAAESSEKLGINHRSLHLALRAISSESPIAGAALTVSMLGAVGAIYAVVELFRLAKEKLKEYNDELDAAGDAMEKPIGIGVEEIGKAWDVNKEKLAAYYAALNTAGQGSDKVEQEIKNIKARDEIEYQGKKKLLEVLEKIEGQKRQQKTLDLLDDEHESRKTGELVTEKLMLQRLQETEPDNVKKLQDAATQASLAKENNDKQIENLRKSTAPVNGDDELKKLVITDPRRQQDEAQKKLDAANKQIARAKEQGWTGSLLTGPEKNAQDAQLDLDTATLGLNRQKHLLAQAIARQQAVDTAAATTQKEADDAKSLSEKHANRLAELPDEITESQTQEQQKVDNVRKIDSVNTGAGDITTAQKLSEAAES